LIHYTTLQTPGGFSTSFTGLCIPFAALFHAMNNGKQSIRADFSDKDCLARVRAFILEHADVVIQNLKPGNLESHGLGAQALSAEKPSLI
jgi:crotonobetainyl-CoA:carnitine CoA-transferase CaiB-like acyl-CoA transferase